MLERDFFDRDALVVARALIGKVIRHKHRGRWLSASIVETEAYFRKEKGSHASLGETPSRRALFMPAGTIYMYYARGGDSLNVSCRGPGNAVLIKGAYAVQEPKNISAMQRNNPINGRVRDPARLCSGQTLLCASLGLEVERWNQKTFDPERFYFEDVGYRADRLIRARRLGIPEGRDEHLMYRFVDHGRARHATQNPLTKRTFVQGIDYRIVRAL